MATVQYEKVTVTFNSGSANPQTVTLTVPVTVVNNIGNGSATFQYKGVNAGSDVITAAANLAGSSSTTYSNAAQVNWQASNGSLQVGDGVQLLAWGDSPHNTGNSTYPRKNFTDPATASFSGLGLSSLTVMDTSTAGVSQTGNMQGLELDSSFIGSGIGPSAPGWVTFNSAGTPVGHTNPFNYTQDFNIVLLANLIVPSAGQYTLNLTTKDETLWGIGGGATRVSGTGTNQTGYNGQVKTAVKGFPLLDHMAPSSGATSCVSTINFPNAGVYPIEVDWDYWYHSGRICTVTNNGNHIAPVTLITAPPINDGTGNLIITPSGGAPNLLIQNQTALLTVQISNVSYASSPYVPLFEGVEGNLYVSNAGGSTFNFQQYNGQSVDKTAAAAAVFGLNGNNGAWGGRIGVVYDGTNFNLEYNGSDLAAGFDSTTLTLTDSDIAWYDASNKNFDLYKVSASGGGDITSVEVDYLFQPTVASVSPTQVTCGTPTTFTVTLNKSLPPQQYGGAGTSNTLAAYAALSGGGTCSAPVAQYDGNGWLTGWTIAAVPAQSATSVSLQLTMSLVGSVTYLQGNNFVTNDPYTMKNTVVANISATGVAAVAPTPYSFNIPQAHGGSVTSAGFSISASAYSPLNNPLALKFIGRDGATTYDVAPGVVTGTTTQNIGGQMLYVTTFQASSLVTDDSLYTSMGYSVWDTLSGLTANPWMDSTVYVDNYVGVDPNPPDSCPALDMFLEPGVKVADAVVGQNVTTLVDDVQKYLSPNSSLLVTLPIQWVAVSQQECIQLTTANGAEVVISTSTPVPFLEKITNTIKPGVGEFASDAKVGFHVLTDVGHGLEWSALTAVTAVGVTAVSRLYCGGHSFAAGRDAGKRIYTHNILK